MFHSESSSAFQHLLEAPFLPPGNSLHAAFLGLLPLPFQLAAQNALPLRVSCVSPAGLSGWMGLNEATHACGRAYFVSLTGTS